MRWGEKRVKERVAEESQEEEGGSEGRACFSQS